jgi:hypothetical protein
MKVLGINNIVRKDTPIYYRRYYTGNAVMELIGGKTGESAIEFMIETKPTGLNDTMITSMNPKLEYPLVPLHKALRDYINYLDANGGLPQL